MSHCSHSMPQIVRQFGFCSEKCILHWSIGILSFLLLFPSCNVPRLVELAGWSVSTHRQMLAPSYSPRASLPPPPCHTHPSARRTAGLALHSKEKGRHHTVLASLFPAPRANSSHVLCLRVFRLCFLYFAI